MKRIILFFQESYAELRKVTWPSRDEAVASTKVVLVSTLLIAAMLGLSAVLVGRVRLAPEALALEGGVALAVTVIVALLVFGVLPAWATVLLVLLVLVPYAIVISVAEGDRPSRLSTLLA